MTIDTRDTVFVFGSNRAGIHANGAALTALLHHGAKRLIGEGLKGKSYALPTKGFRIESLSLEEIQVHVDRFKAFAFKHPTMSFQVTQVGCGLAGYKPKDIAPMFKGASANCYFDSNWEKYLGDEYQYWGSKS